MRNTAGPGPSEPDLTRLAGEAPRGTSYPAPYGYPYPRDLTVDTGAGGLLEYWLILKRRKGAVILIATLGALAGFLYTLPQTPVYQANASIEVQVVNRDFLNMRQVNPVEQSANSWDNSDIQTQIEILLSKTLLERVAAKFDPEPSKDSAGDYGRLWNWRRLLHLPDDHPEARRREALSMAVSSVRAASREQTRIIEIAVDSSDPKLAADFANALADVYIDYNLETRWQMTQRTGEWLSRQLEEQRVKLEQSEDRLQAYARSSGLMFSGEKENVAEDKLRQLQEALSAAQADRIARQSRDELVRSSPAEALPDVVDDASLRSYQSQLTDLRRQEADLGTTYTAGHSKRRRIQAQIKAIEEALERERRAILGRIRNDYDEAVRREKLLQASYTSHAALVTEQSAKAVQYNILKREVDSNRQLYETMLERVKEASVAAALRASNVRVVDPAEAPEAPYKPQVRLNTLLGLLVGGFFGVVFVIAQDYLDRTVQHPGELRFYANVPELGVIPVAEKAVVRVVYRPRGARRAAGPEATKAVAQREPVAVEMMVRRKRSLAAQSFRSTATSILFSAGNGRRPRVLTVTSPQPGEGKTTVACNLAVALAEINRRVLLIDADLHRPRLHAIFHLDPAHGLSELLAGQGPVTAESLNGSVRPSSISNLYVLPSGAPAPGAGNLLFAERLAALIEYFSRNYEAVLIDTAPMLQIPDARILGRLSDAVVLVVKAGMTTRDMVLTARDRFAEDGTLVLGSVLNQWNPKRGGAYNYYEKYYART
mgnify:CR=1 FL=1